MTASSTARTRLVGVGRIVQQATNLHGVERREHGCATDNGFARQSHGSERFHAVGERRSANSNARAIAGHMQLRVSIPGDCGHLSWPTFAPPAVRAQVASCNSQRHGGEARG